MNKLLLVSALILMGCSSEGRTVQDVRSEAQDALQKNFETGCECRRITETGSVSILEFSKCPERGEIGWVVKDKYGKNLSISSIVVHPDLESAERYVCDDVLDYTICHVKSADRVHIVAQAAVDSGDYTIEKVSVNTLP